MKDKALQWAEYVLPIWEKYFPEDDRPRKAIEAAKSGNAVADAAANAAAYAAAYATYVADAAANAAAYAAVADADAAANAAAYAAVYATYVADAAANAAAYAADAAANAAAYATYVAYAAANAAYAAANAIIYENYGKDNEVQTVNLLFTKERQLEIAEKIKWIDHNPKDVWEVLKNVY